LKLINTFVIPQSKDNHIIFHLEYSKSKISWQAKRKTSTTL